MIAIITSCLRPKESINKQKRSYISLAEREYQTIKCIKEINTKGFEQIIIADNSDLDYDFSAIKSINHNITIIQLKQFQFQNKGINELLMLLTVVEKIPENKAIFKISARYLPNTNFNLNKNIEEDFRIKGYHFNTKRGTMSTRAYFVKDKMIYQKFLLETLNEVFIYPYRIVGLRSLIKFISNIFKPIFRNSFNISIEFASARVLKKQGYNITILATIGIEGIVAGSERNEKLIE